MSDKARPTTTTPTGHSFGTFGGVFTPSILTILGVIMFMRANFVIGQAGILGAILILVLSKLITLSTALSIGAISTNMPVRGGGTYYLISRVLGAEFGGAIGIALFFAVALSVPFYILGFTEALIRSFPTLQPHHLHIALITAGILFGVSFVGADWAIKTQYVIMTFLFLAIAAFMGGQILNFSAQRFVANWAAPTPDQIPPEKLLPFWAVFAIYFPAVTGIDAGLNMSGDLKNPARSIPLGTMAAVAVGFLVYLAQILLGGGAYVRYAPGQPNMIDTPYDLLRDNALFGLGILVTLGVFAATLSSALGSYLGAPRVLQAVARDRIVSPLNFLSRGAGRKDEPRRALVLTGVLTVTVLLWANYAAGNALNIVAAVITMFFLYTYGMMNAAAFVEAVGGNPSFRPTFRLFHWSTAAVGAAGSVIVAFLINPVSAAVAIVLIAGFFWYITRQRLKRHFGDARRGFVYSSTRRNLLQLAEMEEDPRNWRPTVLVFAGNPARRDVLVSYAVWFEAGHGIVFLANVLVGPFSEYGPRRQTAIKQLTDYCREKNIQAFPVVMIADTLEQGTSALLQATCVGPIRPNMVIFGWLGDRSRLETYCNRLQIAAGMGISLVLIDDKALPPAPRVHKRIDLWWRGRKNGSLMVLLAHLLRTNWEWANTEIRILRLVSQEAGRQPAVQALQKLIAEARVEARAEVIVSQRPYLQVLHDHSQDATCVFLGFELPTDAERAQWHDWYTQLTAPLPTTILVCSQGAEDIEA